MSQASKIPAPKKVVVVFAAIAVTGIIAAATYVRLSPSTAQPAMDSAAYGPPSMLSQAAFLLDPQAGPVESRIRQVHRWALIRRDDRASRRARSAFDERLATAVAPGATGDDWNAAPAASMEWYAPRNNVHYRWPGFGELAIVPRLHSDLDGCTFAVDEWHSLTDQHRQWAKEITSEMCFSFLVDIGTVHGGPKPTQWSAAIVDADGAEVAMVAIPLSDS